MTRSFIPRMPRKIMVTTGVAVVALLGGLLFQSQTAYAYGPDPSALRSDSGTLPVRCVTAWFGKGCFGYQAFALQKGVVNYYDVTFKVEDTLTDGHVVSIQRNLSDVGDSWRTIATSSGGGKTVNLSYLSGTNRSMSVRIERSGGTEPARSVAFLMLQY